MGQGVSKCTSLCNRTHCFAGEVTECTVVLPSLQTCTYNRAEEMT